MSFSKYQFLIFQKKLKVRNAIFSLGIRYMLLANKRTQKTAKKGQVAYLFKLKSIL